MIDSFSVFIIELSVEQPLTWPGSATNTRYSRYAGLLLPPARDADFENGFVGPVDKKGLHLEFYYFGTLP